MAADITIRVLTGAGGVVSDAVVGIDFCSIDTDASSYVNRIANPVQAGGNSYEKWIAAQVDGEPAVSVSNFRFFRWIGEGSHPVPYGSAIMWGIADAYATPTAETSTIAVHSLGDSVNLWDAGSYKTLGSRTKSLVMQLQVAADAAPGHWDQQVMFFQYDEI
jgi:hypothetical protein